MARTKIAALNPDTPGSLGNLLRLGQLSDYAYLSGAKIKTKVTASAVETFRDKDGGGFAYLAVAAPHVVVAFRGTNATQLADLWTDLDTKKVKFPKGKVHRGFKRAFYRLWDDEKLEGRLQARLRRVKQPHLWITGHSLGGAIATMMLCHLVLREKGPLRSRIAGVVTYGQPRVMGKGVRNALRDAFDDARYLRCDDYRDPVPTLPARADGFHHGGRCRRWRPGSPWRDRGHVERKLTTNISFKDHTMSRYLDRLEAAQ